MLDVRLITLLPPTPSIGQPPAVQSATTSVTNVLAQLANGTLLSGFIINRDATGNPILRTEKGDVTFTSQFFLKIGSEVVIRVANSGGHQNAHLVSVNGVAPEVAAAQSGYTETPDVLSGRAQTAAPASAQTPLPATGSTIPALVVTPSASPTSQASAPPLPPGTNLLLTVLGYNQPYTTAPSAAPTNTAIAQLIPDAEAPQTAQKTSILSALLPSTPADVPDLPNAPTALQNTVTITATTTPPNAQTNSVASVPITLSNQAATGAQLSGPLGQALLATAIAHYEGDITTLASPLGILRAPNLGGLQQGDQINLRVSSITNPTNASIATASATPTAPLAPITELAHTWTSLSHIVQLLQESGAPLSFAGLPTVTPLASGAAPQPATIGNQVLFFISALKGGDFKNWIGKENMRGLEDKGYGSLIRKAEGEFMMIARQFAEPQAGNWQSLFFPVAVHGEVQQVRAFIKREKKKNEQGKPTGEEDTRFVLEMHLSQLGELQMDGLVKRRDEKLQFDLVVRSLEELPKDVQRDIQTIYTNTAELTGFRGQIMFQTLHQFPIHPMEDIAPHVDDVIV